MYMTVDTLENFILKLFSYLPYVTAISSSPFKLTPKEGLQA